MSLGPSAPARVLRIAFHVKHGELMRVICWPRARLRVLRSSWYNLKPAQCVAGARIHWTLRNCRIDPMIAPYSLLLLSRLFSLDSSVLPRSRL